MAGDSLQTQEGGRLQNELSEQLDDGRLKCRICAHGCRLSDGQRGLCGVRERKGMSLESLVYGRLVAEHIDPIEKKPLFHVQPGSLSYSIATRGCNFHCLHCQNSSISQVSTGLKEIDPGVYRDPNTVATAAVAGGCSSISYTYVEPTVFLEFAYDCSVAAEKNGLKNIFVSNGYMSEYTIELLAPLVTAINIDLKSFSDSFYKKVCGARLAPVLSAISKFKKLGVWVEVTTLVIPGKNDSGEELGEIASFLAGVSPEIPWHVSAFYPSYKMTGVRPTETKTLIQAREIGINKGLQFVYTGNRHGVIGENTLCPSCGKMVIERHGFQVVANRLQAGCCPACRSGIPGIW